MAFDVQNFEEDILTASHTKPVVVDFWAPWCGPCRVLGPIIEKIASEESEKLTLVKVNSDEYQAEAAQFGVRGIPSVKMFYKGAVIDEFTGALPENAVRQWLEKALPGESKDLLREAQNLLDEGDSASARPLLESVLALEPTNPSAAGHLASLVVLEDPDKALALADMAMTGEPRFVHVAESVRQIAGALGQSWSATDEGGSSNFAEAVNALRAGNPEECIQQLIEVLKVNRYYADDAARKLGVALFTLLGPAHEVSRAHRRTFDMWLY